jgi:hypothetical protein
VVGHSWRTIHANGYRAKCRRCNLLEREGDPAGPGDRGSSVSRPETESEQLLLIPTAGGYVLRVRDAGPPAVAGEVIELPEFPGSRYQVTKVSDSPLPGDATPCAYLQPVC